jgi:hypothetical protein
MGSESTGYRFQDAGDEDDLGLAPAGSYSVEFHPSIDDHVYVVQDRNKRHVSFPPLAKLSLQAFYIVNALGLPIVLLIYRHPLLAIASLALNMAFALFFLPATLRFDYRRTFRSIYGDGFENELIRVDLTEDGIHTRHLDDTSFHSWKSVTGISETEDSIFVYLRGAAIPIRKSGFSYVETERHFVVFARSHYENSRPPELPQ